MNVCFIDFEYFRNEEEKYCIKELCIINANNIHNPLLYEFNSNFFNPQCIMKDISSQCDISTTLFYIDDEPSGLKIKTMKKYFPQLRITNYMTSSIIIYRKCLNMCLFYLRNV